MDISLMLLILMDLVFTRKYGVAADTLMRETVISHSIVRRVAGSSSLT
jgi:hypothetical protein